MVAKLAILTYKIPIKLHLAAESCTICSSRSGWPVSLHVQRMKKFRTKLVDIDGNILW